MLEGAITARVQRQLALVNGLWVYKTKGGGGTRSGVQDLLLCYAGRFVAAEMKAEGGRQSDLQKREAERVVAAGGISIIAYNEQDILNVLNRIQPIRMRSIRSL